MIIIKATKKDLKDYLPLKRQSLKDYSKIIGKRIPYIEKEIIKEFSNSVKRDVILLMQDKEKKVGYIMGSFMINAYQKIGYIDDLFILKEYRKKGLATKLIKEFIKIIKKKGMLKAKLGVNAKNINAVNLYNHLGFKISHYDMEKQI